MSNPRKAGELLSRYSIRKRLSLVCHRVQHLKSIKNPRNQVRARRVSIMTTIITLMMQEMILKM